MKDQSKLDNTLIWGKSQTQKSVLVSEDVESNLLPDYILKELPNGFLSHEEEYYPQNTVGMKAHRQKLSF